MQFTACPEFWAGFALHQLNYVRFKPVVILYVGIAGSGEH